MWCKLSMATQYCSVKSNNLTMSQGLHLDIRRMHLRQNVYCSTFNTEGVFFFSLPAA